MTTKTIREYMEQLDEISRRDFLKGAGAAAVAGSTTDSNADWKQEPSYVDKMTDKEFRKFKNVSTNGSAALQYNPDIQSPKFQLLHQNGTWIPEISTPSGRIKVDGGQVLPISFWIPQSAPGIAVILPGNNVDIKTIEQYLLSAKNKILIDASELVRTREQYILTFDVRSMEESLEEASPEAIAKINQITRR